MTAFSNQYASKVFADHPIALWSLDEKAYYLSLIDDNARKFTTYTLSGCTASNSPTLPATPSPFDDDIYSSITKTTTATGTIEAASANLFTLSNIDVTDLKFSVNFFLYQNPTFINWFKVGIRYNNALAVPQEQISAAIPPPASSSWVNFNTEYSVPTSWSGSLKIFIQVNFADSTAGDAASRTVIMSGLSVGQGSQTTCYDSLGTTATTLPAELGLATLTGVAADQYGVLADNGYYLVRNNKMLAHNKAMPIIYGTDHSTQIVSSDVGLPSLVFPGKGMLHESGRNKTYTLEMWLKINPATTKALRILGPLGTNDGLFVKEGFLTLSINGEIGSHFVGDWYRPMLLHILMRDKNVIVLINGEQVINIPFDRTMDLPDTKDWWAIYSYPTISFFSVDCIAVYPYLVPEAVAKRRFIYGQGTPSIQSIDNAYQGSPTTIEFPTAEYDASIIYPDIARWDAGYFNNLNATRDYLSVPDYTLPIINIGGRDVNDWYADNLVVNTSEYPDGTHPKFISFRPNTVTRTNLVTNPSFETNTTGWGVKGSTIARSTAQAYTGSASLLVTTTSAAAYSGASASLVPASAGFTYTVSGYVKIPAGSTISKMEVTGGWFDSSATLISYLPNVPFTVTPGGSWTRVSTTQLAPANTAFLQLYVQTGTGITPLVTDTFYVDALLVEQASSVLAYFDGSYVDPTIKPVGSQAWTGTAHASTSTVTTWNPNGINYQDPSYFNFPSMNVLNDQVAAVYGIFEVESTIATERPLMSFVNITNGDTLKITINGSTVAYKLNGTTLFSESITIGTENLVGINFATAGQALGSAVARFFSSPSSIQLYVGGDGITTFEGKIYSIGLCNQSNYEKITVNFNSNGIAIKGNYAPMLDHFASYTLLPENEYGQLYLDVSVAAEWEEYFPLSYFASYIKDEDGVPVYDLDMLQVNIGYPTVSSSVIWVYSQLRDDPTVGTVYSALRDGPHATYFDLKKNNTTGSSVSTAGSSMQSYLAFQPIATAQNTPLSAITYSRSLDPDSVIHASEEAFPYNTAFSFKDNVIVYPPKANFEDYSLVVYLQINQRSILKNPLKVRSLEISAKNLNYNAINQPNYIGTKFGKKIYPSVNVMGTIDQKAENPLAMYKSSSPYIYTTDKSGIRLVGETPIIAQAQPHAFLPINESAAFDYEVASLQFMVKPEFIEDDVSIKLMEIRHKDGVILYALNKIGGTATISSYYKTSEDILADGGIPSTASWVLSFDGGTPSSVYGPTDYVDFGTNTGTFSVSETAFAALNGTSFYQNGRYVLSPILANGEWNVIGITFPAKLDFSEYSEGGIRLFGGAVFNNVSYYLVDGLGSSTALTTRTWQQVFDRDGAVPAGTTWSYWNGSSWQAVYVLGQSSSYISTPENIFDAYAGTNSEIVDDGYGVQMNHRNAQIVSDATWDTFSLKPA